jgi:hypothetical protein
MINSAKPGERSLSADADPSSGSISLRSISPGERSLSADADPSSGSISLRSISPPSPTRGEGEKGRRKESAPAASTCLN